MVFALFILIAWLSITAFFLIPRRLNKVDNILIFFVIAFIILGMFSIIYKSVQLIQYNYKLEMVFSLFLYRDVILPFGILIYANLLASMKTRNGKITVSVAVLSILFFIEYLTVWTGVRTFTGWNGYMSLLMVATLMSVSAFLGKALQKIQ